MSNAPAVGVAIHTRTIRRIRLGREFPRLALAAASLLGIAASARMVIAPPTPELPPTAHPSPPPDSAAEAYAALFARRYLTWSSDAPLASAHALEQFAGSTLEPAAGLVLPTSGEQRVAWVEVVQQREPVPGEHVYTLAAETQPQGLLYLTVSVGRAPSGALELAGYPAFVGAPAATAAMPAARARPISDAALEVVIRRAMSNYLSGAGTDLAADLTADAVVATPTLPLKLLGMQHPTWSPGGGAVRAVLQAEDRRGVRYTLSYELDVGQSQGRWEISAIQTVPGLTA